MNDILQKPIAVRGAGAWGTALAVQLARSEREVTLWGRDEEQMALLKEQRRNEKYLPNAQFPVSLQVHADIARAVADAQDILIVVPSHAFRETLEKLEYLISKETRVAWATKGFEQDSGKLPRQVACEVLGNDIPMAVLAGPTFAKEVGDGLPTLITVAATNEAFANDMARSLSSDNFRAYTTLDMVGVEVGAAVKNVLAIGAGICDGLKFGANTRVAMITRGLAEMSRLGLALGAEQETFMGLAGMGDLVLTCTDNLSRNRRMGMALAAGKSITEAAAEIGQVVEGVRAAKAVHQVAEKMGVDMPIVTQLYHVLYEGKTPTRAVAELMGRDLKRES